ncbi:MAG: response regulator [Candidatus Abyssobacteria bacterium SURF_5]|uniref:Response regulator n=1 Tax=Abyssobacteria bacterium (strain SURF_5) TaxID=2093360 RepID=A0A3A4N6V8_ABYX5|nr:MAG: response regulator [Candidatus Abyssubacteria bacterium SURF_5]
MATQATSAVTDGVARVLLVDDEEKFRVAMKKQLEVREYKVWDVDNGEDAIKIVRHKNPEVVILDQKMPKMDGIQTLKEIKKIRPEVQVIMLTGFGSTESARLTGKYDVFHYMQKPCVLNDLVEVIEAARKERVYAMARHEIPHIKRGSLRRWLIGAHNARPMYIILGLLLFLAIIATPAPQKLLTLLSTEKLENQPQSIMGYSEYRKMKAGQTITDYYSEKAGYTHTVTREDGKNVKVGLSPKQAAFRARVMIGTLVVAALFWATGAMPVGVTALLVGMLMYFFGVLPPDRVAAAYAKDSVIFIFGVLAVSAAIAKTGLDRRIGLLLLGTSSSLAKLALIFAPLLAVSAAFLSEHALVAFIAPIFILVYGGAVRAAGINKDRNLAVMMILMLTFVANVGGPGSPAAGGRNAVMLGILSDYGITLPFAQWVKYGLPTVPVMALVISMYFFLLFRKKIKVKNLNVAAEVRKESEKIGKMTKNEYRTAAVLVLLIILWSTVSSKYGMGGPVLLCIVLLNVLGILRWRDINQIHWDVVALYASASAMGAGLAYTGAALWMADAFIGALPEVMTSGIGLCVATSIFSGVITNFMSDGATVAAIGPITVPMATLSGTSPIMVGLATAFASSFAFMLIIGTPNNAIAYSMAKDPETGEQLVTTQDFLIHGSVVLLLSFIVLWGWTFFGYWRWMGF